MTNTAEHDKLAHAREQARAQMDSISEMVAKLRASEDQDAYEEMAEQLARDAGYEVMMFSGETENQDRYWWGRKGSEVDETAYETEEEAWLACCDYNNLRPDYDEARQEIEGDPISVQVRSGWNTPGDTLKAEEYEILLCTGGPAVRIVGDLNDYGEPTRARLECQDWGTPWTEVFDVAHSDLLAYARCFYFGE